MRRLPVWASVALLVACASSEAPETPSAPTPAAEAGVNDAGASDGGVDDASTPDASGRDPFPDACAPDAFCPVALSLDPRQTMLSISARSESDVWITGSLGAVVHFDGTSWTSVPMPTSETFGAVLARSAEETWLGSSTHAIYINKTDAGPSSWTAVASSEVAYTLRDLWSAPGSARVWAALDEETDRRTATLVRLEIRDGVLTASPVEGGAISVATNALDGLTKDELWAVGDGGAAYRITAADSATPVVERLDAHTNQSLNGVSVRSADDVWAVGVVGTVRHYRGPAIGWERVDVPVTVHLNGVAAVAPDDVWVVGDGATILHYDGATWSSIAIAGLEGVRPRLRAIAALSDRVIVAGERIILELRTAEGS